MKKGKIRIVVYIIGAVLVVGNGYALVSGYLLPKRGPWPVSMGWAVFETYLGNVSLFPVGLPVLLSLFIKGPCVWCVYAVTGIWQAAVLLCGIGILAFQSAARGALLALCVARLVISLAAWPVTVVLYKGLAGKALSFTPQDGVTILIPLVYMALLLWPKVKEQFKESTADSGERAGDSG